MTKPLQPEPAQKVVSAAAVPVAGALRRIKSQDLLRDMREIEIDHDGRIYKLRLTQLNKLILTA